MNGLPALAFNAAPGLCFIEPAAKPAGRAAAKNTREKP
jgi:hypothetical protein